MSSVFDIVSIVILAAAATAFLAMICGALKRPVVASEGQRIYSVVTVSGGSPGLELTVRGLAGLRANAAPDMRIVIADGGMDAETRLIAELLARDDERIILCDQSELQAYVL